jgi:hypothetical protein
MALIKLNRDGKAVYYLNPEYIITINVDEDGETRLVVDGVDTVFYAKQTPDEIMSLISNSQGSSGTARYDER